MTLRIPTDYVRRALASALRRDLKQAAGVDRALQTHERDALRVPLAKAAALTIDDAPRPGVRERAPPRGTDLPVEDVVQRGVSLADAVWAQANQAAGPGRAFLSHAELHIIAKGDPDVARATDAAVDVVRGTQDPAHLQLVVDESVRNTFGVEAPLELLASRVYAGALVVDVRAANGSARLTLGRDWEGKRAVVDARLLDKPTVLDPELSLSFAATLTTLGLVKPVVRAIGHAGDAYALVVAHGAGGARKDEALRLTFKADGTATRAPFSFDDGAAREQAAQLAQQASLDQAALAQAPSSRLQTLEVFLRRDALDPAAFTVVDAADSPTGFDPARELQYQVPPVLGDLAGFVTVDKTTGAMRAETYN